MSGPNAIPFDDTVQLDEMSVDGEENNIMAFPPVAGEDHVRILSAPNGIDPGGGQTVSTVSTSTAGRRMTKKSLVAVLVLTLINLLNYMDRYTLAGVLPEIQEYYSISNSEAGLLQTSFIVSYMLLSPVFGYMGDRYNRKIIMAGGIAFWSAVTFAGSFIPRDHFWAFLCMRGLVGVGEASYSTIAPTIIADMFVSGLRTKALSVFYFAIPVGSGLGYVVGSSVANALGAWQWALRVTPILGVVCVILILTVVREPTRGGVEGATHLSHTGLTSDLSYLVRNKSFMLASFGFTCVAFVAGALALWAPSYMDVSIRSQGNYLSMEQVSLLFGAITCVAGLLGVGLGAFSASKLRPKIPTADPLVCAFGLMGSAPFLFFAIYLSGHNTIATWVLIFVGETLLCLNWALVADIVLYVVIPTRRSMAEAVQILLSHAFGDAGSPYLIGLVSDHVKVKYPGTPSGKFEALQYSLYINCFVCALGGAFFLFCALFLREDRAKADRAARG